MRSILFEAALFAGLAMISMGAGIIGGFLAWLVGSDAKTAVICGGITAAGSYISGVLRLIAERRKGTANDANDWNVLADGQN